jgi:putative hydrolase of the HAD superfamily
VNKLPTRFCLVFDLDDTLYLERDYAASGFRAVGQWVSNNLGILGFGEAAQTEFEKGARGDVFNRALAALGLPAPADRIEQLVGAYRKHSPEIELAPDAASCLRNIQGRATLAMITDGHPDSQRHKIAALGLANTFSPLVLTGAWGPEFYKPHRRAFQYVAAHAEGNAGSQGMEFIYVGDNPAKDFQAPLAMGWKTVRIRRPGGLHFGAPNLPHCLPGAEIADLSRLCERIGR